MSLTLADFTARDLIRPFLRAADAPGVIHELVTELDHAGRLSDAIRFEAAVSERERHGSLEIQPGVIFAHGRVPNLERAVFAFGRSEVPLEWGPIEGGTGPVRLIFLMAVPEEDSAQYLALLSAVARLVGNRSLLERLLNSTDVEGVLDVFQGMALRAV